MSAQLGRDAVFRHTVPCFLAILLFTSLAIAQNDPTADDLKRTEASIAKVFDAAGVPASKNAPWVVVELGSAGWNNERLGWLVQEDSECITLLQAHGVLSVVRRPRAGEIRPKADSSRPIYMSDVQAASAQVAWSVRAADYEATCQKFIRRGSSHSRLRRRQSHGIS